jgi:hypothetical protein
VTGALIGIIGFAVLFAAFGLLQRSAAGQAGCGTCSHSTGDAQCASCEWAGDTTESSNAAT